jgi:Zn-dependent protease/predicted transcriptional regulator
MMTNMSFRIATVDGIPVRLHFTLIIAFLLISWSLATYFMPDYLPGLTTTEYWIMGAAGSAILFVSVLLHELAHSKLATRYGIKVNQIVLFLFGGVSDIAGELKDYRKDAKMAIAGPLTSFAISGAFALALLALTVAVPDGGTAVKVVQGILYYSALINVMLGAFNLIPAFPSDGGRILRAMLVRRKKDYNEATKTAANVGIAISYAFMGFGFFAMLAGSFMSGLWILLIGWFLMSGAQSYVSQIELSSVLSVLRLRDIMNTNVISVKASFPADRLLEGYFRTYMKGAFPVVDDRGVLLGMVTLKKLLQINENQRAKLSAAEVMIPREDLPVMSPDATADAALMQMTKAKIGKVFVCDGEGKLIGLVSKTDILNVEMERDEIAQTLKGYKP